MSRKRPGLNISTEPCNPSSSFSLSDTGSFAKGNFVVGNGHTISADAKNAFVAGFRNVASDCHVFVVGSDNQLYKCGNLLPRPAQAKANDSAQKSSEY